MKSIAIKLILGAAVIGGGAFAASTHAQAMPAPRASVLAGATDPVAQVRWVCGPYRCWWRPNYVYYGRPWGYGYRRWGYHRPYGRWGYGGWHRGYGWHRGWRRW